MKNEANTRNSTKAIRKSCNFAIGAALLSTLLFASAANAQVCHSAFTNSGVAWVCQTNNTGTVWVIVSGIWQSQAYYTVDTTWFQVYHYGPKLWTAENRLTHELLVLNTQGQWIPYSTYASTSALEALTTLLNSQPQTGGTAPILTIAVSDFRTEYCRYAAYFRQQYASLPVPVVYRDSLCGQ